MASLFALRPYCLAVPLWVMACTALAQIAPRPTTQFGYDPNGNLTTVTDPLGHATRHTYDALNRLTSQTLPAPVAGQPNPVIQYQYDARGYLIAVTDARNLTTRYSVNAFGNVTRIDSPDTGITTFTYDPADNLTSRTDARGKVTKYAYDVGNRLTKVTYADGTVTTLSYDAGQYGKGRLTGMADPGSLSTVWTHDIHGRILSKTQTQPTDGVPRSHTVSYGYEAGTGRLMSMTYPSGKVLTLTYDEQSKKLSSLQFDGTPIASQLQYHPFGAVKSMQLGNGMVHVRTQDLNGRINSYTLAGQTTWLTYDAAGRLTGRDRMAAVEQQRYGYDDLDRLTSTVTANTSQSLSYDLSGNRTSATLGSNIDACRIDAASNRLIERSNPAKSYSYDAAGHLTGDGANTYDYNARGRLWQAQIPLNGTLVKVTYRINGLGQRISKAGPGSLVTSGWQLYVYDEQGRLIGEYDKLGRAQKEHVWLDGKPVAMVVYAYASGSDLTPSQSSVYYVETDQTGTPRLLTGPWGRARWRWEGLPFGETPPDEQPTAGLGAIRYHLRFPGQYFDPETGLFYNYFRDYDPITGRYVQSDPIGLAGGINTYTYVSNQPTRYVDPLGLWSTDAHDYLIDQAFPNLPPEQRDIVKEGSAYIDTPKYQDDAHSGLHAMTSGTMNNAQARAQFCKFVKDNLARSKAAKEQGDLRYLYYLGMAMHPIMDYTSPAHRGWQAWHGARDASKHGPWPTSLETSKIAKQPHHTKETVDLMKKALSGELPCECQ